MWTMRGQGIRKLGPVLQMDMHVALTVKQLQCSGLSYMAYSDITCHMKAILPNMGKACNALFLTTENIYNR